MVVGAGSEAFPQGFTRKKSVPNPQGARCQKCLQLGHWTFACKNKKKHLHRSSRTSMLNKRLNQAQNPESVPGANKAAATVGKKKKKKKKSNSSENSSSSSDSESDSSDSSDDSSDSSDSSSSDSSSSSSSSSEDSSDSSSSSDSSDSSSSGSSSASSTKKSRKKKKKKKAEKMSKVENTFDNQNYHGKQDSVLPEVLDRHHNDDSIHRQSKETDKQSASNPWIDMSKGHGERKSSSDYWSKDRHNEEKHKGNREEIDLKNSYSEVMHRERLDHYQDGRIRDNERSRVAEEKLGHLPERRDESEVYPKHPKKKDHHEKSREKEHNRLEERERKNSEDFSRSKDEELQSKSKKKSSKHHKREKVEQDEDDLKYSLKRHKNSEDRHQSIEKEQGRLPRKGESNDEYVESNFEDYSRKASKGGSKQHHRNDDEEQEYVESIRETPEHRPRYWDDNNEYHKKSLDKTSSSDKKNRAEKDDHAGKRKQTEGKERGDYSSRRNETRDRSPEANGSKVKSVVQKHGSDRTAIKTSPFSDDNALDRASRDKSPSGSKAKRKHGDENRRPPKRKSSRERRRDTDSNRDKKVSSKRDQKPEDQIDYDEFDLQGRNDFVTESPISYYNRDFSDKIDVESFGKSRHKKKNRDLEFSESSSERSRSPSPKKSNKSKSKHSERGESKKPKHKGK